MEVRHLIVERELTKDQLLKLLEVKLTEGLSTIDIIEDFGLDDLFFRFVVTKDNDIFIGPRYMSHGDIQRKNGLETKDCPINSGNIRQNENNPNELIFSYQAAKRTILNDAVEDRLLEFFGNLLDKRLKLKVVVY